MKVSCVGCKAQYDIDEKKIPPDGMSVSCPKCGSVFEIKTPVGDAGGDDAPFAGPDFSSSPSESETSAPSADSGGDSFGTSDSSVGSGELDENDPFANIDDFGSSDSGSDGDSYMMKTAEGIETGPFDLDVVINLISNKKVLGNETISKNGGPFSKMWNLPEFSDQLTAAGFSQDQMDGGFGGDSNDAFSLSEDDPLGSDFSLEDESPLDDIPPADAPSSDFAANEDTGSNDFSFGENPPPSAEPPVGGDDFMGGGSSLSDMVDEAPSATPYTSASTSFDMLDDSPPLQAPSSVRSPERLDSPDALGSEMGDIISDLESKTKRSKLPIIIAISVTVILVLAGVSVLLMATSKSLPQKGGFLGDLANKIQSSLGTDAYIERMVEQNLQKAKESFALYSPDALSETEKALKEVLKFRPKQDGASAMLTRAAMGIVLINGDLQSKRSKAIIDRAVQYLKGVQNTKTDSLSLLARGETAIGLGEFDKALELAEQLVGNEATSADGYYLRALVVWYREQDAPNAIAQLDAALAVAPDSIPFNFLKVRIYASEGEGQKLEEAAKTLLAKNPKHIATLTLTGVFKYQIEKDYEGAISNFTTLLNKMGSSLAPAEKARIHNHLGEIYLIQGENEQALAQFQNAVKTDPQKSDYEVGVGITLFKTNKIADAVIHINQAIELDNNNVKAYTYLGLINENLQNASEAETNYKKALELDSADIEANSFYGSFLLKQGRPDEAEQNFIKALEAAPENYLVHLEFAHFSLAVSNYDVALTEYQKALELKPGNVESIFGLGNVYLKTGRTNEAIDYLQQAKRLNPNDSSLLQGLGRAHFQKRSYQTAIEYFQKAIKITPNNLEALNDLGLTYIATKEYEKARAAFSRIQEQDSNSAFALYGLGRVYLFQNRDDSAVTSLKRAVVLDPSSVDIHFYYGQALTRLGKEALANEHFQKTLEIDENYYLAKLALASYYFRSQRDDKALALLKEVVRQDSAISQANLMLGTIYNREPNVNRSKSLNYLRRAVSRAGDKAEKYQSFLALGTHYIRYSDYTKALVSFKKAARYNDTEGEPHMQIGFCYKLKDSPNIDRARSSFQKALELNLNDYDQQRVREAIQYLY
jgi:predicted Zn finger-like uncharacterized protein